MDRPSIGVMFCREFLPEQIPAFALAIETSGLDDLWFVEDAFFNGGISAAAVALAKTERISVGIGILPAVVRNAAYNAMDLATLARNFPGRLQIGFGHGATGWIKQVGEFPASQMKALEEVTTVTRRLLRGEEVSFAGSHVQLNQVQLVFPPVDAPPVSLGVISPKSLALSGRVADGTIMVELTGPALVRKNLEIIRTGMAEAGRTGESHQVTVFAYWSQGEDPAKARSRIRPLLARRIEAEGLKDLVAAGFADAAREILDRGGADLLAREMPDSWIDEIAVVGSPSNCLSAIDRLAAAGVARIVLVPPVDGTIDQISAWASALDRARNAR